MGDIPYQAARIINMLVPLAANEKPPVVQLTKQDGNQIALEIQWPSEKNEKVQLNPGAEGNSSPATMSNE